MAGRRAIQKMREGVLYGAGLFIPDETIVEEKNKLKATLNILQREKRKIKLQKALLELDKIIIPYNEEYTAFFSHIKASTEKQRDDLFKKILTITIELKTALDALRTYKNDDIDRKLLRCYLAYIGLLQKQNYVSRQKSLHNNRDNKIVEYKPSSIEKTINKSLDFIFTTIQKDFHQEIELTTILEILRTCLEIGKINPYIQREEILYKKINPYKIDLQAYIDQSEEALIAYFYDCRREDNDSDDEKDDEKRAEEPTTPDPLAAHTQCLLKYLEKHYRMPSSIKDSISLQNHLHIHTLIQEDKKRIYCDILPIPINEHTLLPAINKSLQSQHELPVDMESFKDRVRITYYGNRDRKLKKWIDDDLKKRNLDIYDKWQALFFKSQEKLFLDLLSHLLALEIHIYHSDAKQKSLQQYKKIDSCPKDSQQEAIRVVSILEVSLPSKKIHYEGLFLRIAHTFSQLQRKLGKSPSREDRCKLLQERGDLYYKDAPKKGIKRLERRSALTHALEDYEKAYAISAVPCPSYVRYCQCLLALRQSDKVWSLLQSSDLWCLKRLQNPTYALIEVEALLLQKKYDEAQKKLQEVKVRDDAGQFVKESVDKKNRLEAVLQKRLQLQQRINTSEDDYLAKKSVKKYHDLPKQSGQAHKPYRILSLDGGRIRGIIPAIWLMNIEKKTQRPISELFDMVAGTSTGGILAAALTIPNSYQRPTYTAVDVANIYFKERYRIFYQPSSSIGTLMSPKYGAEGITNVIKKYCLEQTIKDQLNELFITSIDEKRNYTPYFFTRKKAREDVTWNYTLKDILRATSAAPTFFPPHRLGDKSFIDGGVKFNNLAMEAYQYAKNKLKKFDIFMLSLGTGEYTKVAPKNLSGNRGLLYWANNIAEACMMGQESALDTTLETLIPPSNYRYQPSLPELIPLDGRNQATIAPL